MRFLRILALAPLRARGLTKNAVVRRDIDVFALDGACFALAHNGSFVVRDALSGYKAIGTAANQPFRLQRSSPGTYLLYGTNDDFIATGHGTNFSVFQAPAAGPEATWRVTDTGTGNEVLLVAGESKKMIAVDPLTGKLTLKCAGSPFTLRPATNCSAAPEAEINVSGIPFIGIDESGHVEGLADLHGHLTAFEFIGGDIHCGEPWSPHGITAALVDCPDHEPNGTGAWWENLASGAYPSGMHDTTGWPTFRDWPKHSSWTHEAMYYRWLERAWRGGLRIYTNFFVNNAALCEIYPLKHNPCEDMASVRLQAARIYELQDFIDTQAGGAGAGWFRIVHTPGEARAVVEAGKLAVTLGVEVSQPFGCGIVDGVPQCSEADIDAGLDELLALGVRRLFVCHKFDNALCGVRFDEGIAGSLINVANFYSTGRFWDAETCPAGSPHDNNITAVQLDLLQGPLAALLGPEPPLTVPVYPPPPHCNTIGLTALGEYVVKGMMKRGMIVDVDHMSVKAANQTLVLLEEARDGGYAGVVSGHSWMDPAFYSRVYKIGGMAVPYGFGTEPFYQAWKEMKAAADSNFFFGFGAGFDTGGFGAQPPPRGGAAVRYPFRTFDGGSEVNRQRTGVRVFDVNIDGLAHYGLLPDWLEDLRIVAGNDGETLLTDMARGAEAYIQMWERAVQDSE
jgi:hypothetical protein